MNLKQVYILFCLANLLSAATIKSPSEIQRQKRTIQYFWDGLFSVLKDRLPMTARTVNDHRASTLVSLAKLSSTSTPTRNVEYFDDDDIIGNALNFNHDTSQLTFQVPIPSIASTLLASTENRVLQPTMTKRAELDVKMTKQSNQNSTNQVEKTVSKPSTTIAPKQIPMTTVASIQTQPTIDVITLNQTQTTTAEPNRTQTTTTTPTTTATTTMNTTAANTTTAESIQSVLTELELSTISPDNSTDIFDGTTLNPLESVIADDTQTKMEKRNAPMKASNLHTTQFYDGPLIVENNRNAHHKPIYLDTNCVEINCINNAIESRNLPDSRIAPIISMTIALPVSAASIDQRRQNGQLPIQNYNVFTLHTHIPIYTEVNSKRLSNEIIDPPTTGNRKAQ